MISKTRKEISDEWMIGRRLKRGEVERMTESGDYRNDIVERVPAGKAGQ
jgi:hypothetical protein